MAKATEKFEKKLTGVTLELTVEEAKHLQTLVGRTTGNVLYPVYQALCGVFGYLGVQFEVLDDNGVRVGALTVKERG